MQVTLLGFGGGTPEGATFDEARQGGPRSLQESGSGKRTVHLRYEGQPPDGRETADCARDDRAVVDAVERGVVASGEKRDAAEEHQCANEEPTDGGTPRRVVHERHETRHGEHAHGLV